MGEGGGSGGGGTYPPWVDQIKSSTNQYTTPADEYRSTHTATYNRSINNKRNR